jgi:hypothetical protein
MPVTGTQLPILSQFFHTVQHRTRTGNMQAPPPPENDRHAGETTTSTNDSTTKPLPKGVVLGKDGKP